MKELNGLVVRAKAACNGRTVGYMEKVDPHTILAIAEAFRALEQRAEAAEAKLAELERQEPVAWLNTREGDQAWPCVFIAKEKAANNREWVTLAPWVKTQPLFTRPAPAINIAELVPGEKSTDVDYAYYPLTKACHEGWNACRAAILRKIEEAK